MNRPSSLTENTAASEPAARNSCFSIVSFHLRDIEPARTGGPAESFAGDSPHGRLDPQGPGDCSLWEVISEGARAPSERDPKSIMGEGCLTPDWVRFAKNQLVAPLGSFCQNQGCRLLFPFRGI